MTMLHRHIFRTRVYDHLVDRFVEDYRAAGTCTDVLGFLRGGHG
jgi:hypothetical protein